MVASRIFVREIEGTHQTKKEKLVAQKLFCRYDLMEPKSEIVLRSDYILGSLLIEFAVVHDVYLVYRY